MKILKDVNQAKVDAIENPEKWISKDMKSRGFSFVGPTIIYSYLQAIGVINDHIKGCVSK